MGAIATSASLWIIRMTIAICYLVIRRYGKYEIEKGLPGRFG
jgi:hypothetical protein